MCSLLIHFFFYMLFWMPTGQRTQMKAHAQVPICCVSRPQCFLLELILKIKKNKKRYVARSSTKAEYRAVVTEVTQLQSLLKNWCMKHTTIDFHFVGDLCEFSHVSFSYQLADALTKTLIAIFKRHDWCSPYKKSILRWHHKESREK